MLGHKENFGKKKNFGQNILLGPKKKCWSKNILRPEENFCQKIFFVKNKNLGPIQILGPQNFCVKKILAWKCLWVQKNFVFEKNLILKNFRSKKVLSKNLVPKN